MRKVTDALIILTLLILGACGPEITSPEGGAAIGKVVPFAVPDVWCTGISDAGQDTITAKGKDRPRAACYAPEQPAPGNDPPTAVVDSL
jgi:hypothetical protein